MNIELLQQNEKLTQYTFIIYILYAVSLFVGITSIAAIIMNYLKRDEAKGTWLESHFNWQIKTFWYSVIGFFVGFILSFIGIGFLVILAISVWYIYRIVKGFIAFKDKKTLPDSFF